MDVLGVIVVVDLVVLIVVGVGFAAVIGSIDVLVVFVVIVVVDLAVVIVVGVGFADVICAVDALVVVGVGLSSDDDSM